MMLRNNDKQYNKDYKKLRKHIKLLCQLKQRTMVKYKRDLLLGAGRIDIISYVLFYPSN